MKQKIIEIIIGMAISGIIYSFGVIASNIQNEKRFKDLEKRYAYTDNELDQCVKRNLELRRK